MSVMFSGKKHNHYGAGWDRQTCYSDEPTQSKFGSAEDFILNTEVTESFGKSGTLMYDPYMVQLCWSMAVGLGLQKLMEENRKVIYPESPLVCAIVE